MSYQQIPDNQGHPLSHTGQLAHCAYLAKPDWRHLHPYISNQDLWIYHISNNGQPDTKWPTLGEPEKAMGMGGFSINYFT